MDALALAKLLDPNTPPESVNGSRAVLYDDEFRRIEALPRRVAPTIYPELLSQMLRTPTGTKTLFFEQAWVLTELYDNVVARVGGAAGIIPVGRGKTLMALLAGTLIGAQRPVMLVPAHLKKKTDYELPQYARDWRVHPNIRTLSNQTLQTLPNRGLLYRYMPDLIVLDEVHEYKNIEAAKTQRLIEYCEKFPNTIVVALSGTFIKDSLKDFAHILSLCFPRRATGQGWVSVCPVPHYKSRALQDWCDATDERVRPEKQIAPGALYRLVRGEQTPRQAIGDRITETYGVVAPPPRPGDDCPAALTISVRRVQHIPEVIQRAFTAMRTTGTTLSGDVLTDDVSARKRFREIAYGFYYRWMWPGGRPDVEWLEYRKQWRKFVRWTLRYNQRGLDSALAVQNAVINGEYGGDGWTAWAKWVSVRDRYKPHPPIEAVWLDDYILNDAKTFNGLTWVEHQAVGERLAQLSGRPYFGAGDSRILRYNKPCVLSIHAHSTGLNLQDRYNTNLFLTMPPSKTWEQSVGRTHRTGQEAHEVTVEVYMHCNALWTAWNNALSEAQYVLDLTKQPQKILTATKDVLTPDEVVAKMSSADPLWASSSDQG